MPGFVSRVFITTLVLFSSASTAFSQRVIDLYQYLLPPKVQDDKLLRNSVSLTLEKLAEIHPDLIYYYLEYVNLKYNFPETERYQQYFSGIKDIERRYTRRRNRWAREQIAYLAQNERNFVLLSSACKYFEKLILQTVEADTDTVVALNVDTQRLHFFALRYYAPLVKKTYDQTIDYAQQRKTSEDKIYQQFQAQAESASDGANTLSLDSIEIMLRYASVFMDTTVQGREYFFPAKYALLVTRNKYTKRATQPGARPKIIIAAGRKNTTVFDFRATIPIIEFDTGYGWQQSTTFSQNLFSLQAQFSISRYRTALSYLNLQFSLLESHAGHRFTFLDSIRYVGRGEYEDGKLISRKERTLKFTSGEAVIEPMRSYFVGISSPVFCVSKYFVAEAGVYLGLNRAPYSLSYNYVYKFIERAYTETGSVEKVTEEGESGEKSADDTIVDWFISPAVSLIVRLPFGLSLKMTAFHKHLSASAGLRVF